MKKSAILLFLFLWKSLAFAQKPYMRGGDEGYLIITDSMLVHEYYLYTSGQLEKMPVYHGGDEEFKNYVKRNLKYPANALKYDTQGKVVISFIVERSGRLTHIQIMRGIGEGCDEEAARLIRKSGKWVPGKIHNIPVRSSYMAVVMFIKPDSPDQLAKDK